MYQVVLVAVVLCFLFKVLNVNNSPARSLFYSANAKLLEQILQKAPSLAEPYMPTRLWGFSGHFQTIVQGILDHVHSPLVNGKRFFFVQPKDGSTVTYDLYHPIEQHVLHDDYTLVLCPGICNSSETIYVRRVVYQAQFQGYRVAVLNHIGALKDVPISTPRIFCHGDTDDYEGLIHDIVKRYPNTKIICVGFSMGGNMVTKYLGQKEKVKPPNVVAGVSVCQGYDALRVAKYLLQWENFRRLYLFVMTENMRGILRRWQRHLFPSEEWKREHRIVERDVWSAATMLELDDVYTRKMMGFDTVEELYRWGSSNNYLDGVSLPLVCINALDDPIIPPPVLDETIKAAAKTHPNLVYIEQKYGGHLGFYEGGLICPNPVTWLDRNVVNLADALAAYAEDNKGKVATSSSEYTTDSEEEEFRLLKELKLKPAIQQQDGAKEVAPTEDEESVGEASDAESTFTKQVARVIKRPRFVCGRKSRVTFRVSKATRIACKI